MSSRPCCLYLNVIIFSFISQSYCKMLPLGMFMGQPSYKSYLCARVFSKIQSSQACTIAVRIFSSFSLRLKVCTVILVGPWSGSVIGSAFGWSTVPSYVYLEIYQVVPDIYVFLHIFAQKQNRSVLYNKINNPTGLGKDQPDSWHAGCTELSHILPLSLHSWC